MKYRFRAGVIFVICLILSTAAFGQADSAKARGCVSEEGKQLNFLIGKWKVKSKTRIADSPGKFNETDATSEIRYIFKQCLLVEKLKTSREGRPLTVVALYSYNNISKNYQRTFGHSEHGMLSLYEGPLVGNKFEFRYVLKVGERTMHFRRELSKVNGGFHLTAKRSFDGGKSWRVESILEYSQ